MTPALLTCGICLEHVDSDKAAAAGWLLLHDRQLCPAHREPLRDPDVIDRLIAGERVDSLSREDMDAVWRWVEDPRVGLDGPVRRLLTLLLYELRKGRPS